MLLTNPGDRVGDRVWARVRDRVGVRVGAIKKNTLEEGNA